MLVSAVEVGIGYYLHVLLPIGIGLGALADNSTVKAFNPKAC